MLFFKLIANVGGGFRSPKGAASTAGGAFTVSLGNAASSVAPAAAVPVAAASNNFLVDSIARTETWLSQCSTGPNFVSGGRPLITSLILESFQLQGIALTICPSPSLNVLSFQLPSGRTISYQSGAYLTSGARLCTDLPQLREGITQDLASTLAPKERIAILSQQLENKPSDPNFISENREAVKEFVTLKFFSNDITITFIEDSNLNLIAIKTPGGMSCYYQSVDLNGLLKDSGTMKSNNFASLVNGINIDIVSETLNQKKLVGEYFYSNPTYMCKGKGYAAIPIGKVMVPFMGSEGVIQWKIYPKALNKLAVEDSGLVMRGSAVEEEEYFVIN